MKYISNDLPILKWHGLFENMSAELSLKEYRFAIKLLDNENFIYECYLPDPEFEDCCIHIKKITDNMVYSLLNRKGMMRNFLTFCDVKSFGDSHPISQLLFDLCEFTDIIDFFNLESDDANAYTLEETIACVTEETREVDPVRHTLEYLEESTFVAESLAECNEIRVAGLQYKLHSAVHTYFDDLLESRGLSKSPKFLWQLKVTDEEYQKLKDYIRDALTANKDKANYCREIALFFAEYHRREYDKIDDEKKEGSRVTIAFDGLGFSKSRDKKLCEYKELFKDCIKDGAYAVNAELYQNQKGSKLYVYSLQYSGGLPLKKFFSDPKDPTWHKLIKNIMSVRQGRHINFTEEFSSLVKGVVANNLETLKEFCQQLQDAIIVEDYKILPFYCYSEEDSRYQYFLTEGRDAINELKSRNPFRIEWFYDVNMHRKVLVPICKVTGPNSLLLSSDFFEDNSDLLDSDCFTIDVCEDGVEIATVTYHKTNRDFYGEKKLDIEIPYREGTNITIRCIEKNKLFASEELDLYSSQLISERQDGMYTLCSNRIIGHKETVVIVPDGWNIENEDKYKVEDGYRYLNTTASIIVLPIGDDKQSVTIFDDNGSKKTFSASIPLCKLIVLTPSYVQDIKENAFYNVKRLQYRVKTPDGKIDFLRTRNWLFCSDRRSGDWSKEPLVGYVYVKPANSSIYVDPIRILNLGNNTGEFNVKYGESNADVCNFHVEWHHGDIENFQKDKEWWIIKKKDCEDSRYVEIECRPKGMAYKFNLKVKTHFRDFSLFDAESNPLHNGEYISIAQLSCYTYHLQDVDVNLILQLKVDKSIIKYKYDIKGTNTKNGLVPVLFTDCSNKRSEKRAILTDSSFDNLLGGFEKINKMLYSSPLKLRDAEINVICKFNGKSNIYHIKKYPYLFEKIGFKEIIVKDNTGKIIDYYGTIRVLPLYDYEGVKPLELVKFDDGYLLPDACTNWKDVLLVSGKSEWVLPHSVDTTIEGETEDEIKQERFKNAFFPMRDIEYPNAMIWDSTWKRCIYWFETSVREHIPSDSLWDLICAFSSSELIVRFVFNLYLKGLTSEVREQFEEYKIELMSQMETLSRQNAFLWVWIKKDDYSLQKLQDYLEIVLDSSEFYQKWCFYKNDYGALSEFITSKDIYENKKFGFLVDIIQDFAFFMDLLRIKSLDSFVAGNNMGKDATTLLNIQIPIRSKIEDLRDEVLDRLPLLSEYDENQYFAPLFPERKNEAANLSHFVERARMFINHLKGDLDIFKMKPHIRRSVLYYTSYYMDSFIKLWLNETSIR